MSLLPSGMLIHWVFPALAAALVLPFGCSNPEAPAADTAKPNAAAAKTTAAAGLPEVRYYMLSDA